MQDVQTQADASQASRTILASGQAFLQGCREVSWVGTIGALVVCGLIYAGLIFGITARWFAAHPTRFMVNKTDGFPALKAAAVRLTEKPALHKYRVVLVGDSSIREGITSNADLQARVSKGAKRPIEVVPLTAGGLTQLDAVDLCGMLRGHLHGEVILEVSPFWMAKGEDVNSFDHTLDRIGYDSNDLGDELVIAGGKRPLWFKNFFLRNIRFMLSRTDAIFNQFHPYAAPAQHIRELEGDDEVSEIERDMPRVFRLTQDIHRRCRPRSAIYERMIMRLKSAGIGVVLIDAPLNPHFLTDASAKEGLPTWVMEIYHRARTALARRTHVPVWDLNQECGFIGDDFRDAFHIDSTPPRERFTQALAEHIIASVKAPKVSKSK